MEPSYAPINEKVDVAVKQYVDAIIEYITTINPDIDYDLDYDETTNSANTQKASIADIHTERGFVTIFPDFMHESAKASLLNRGMISAMELEGFDEDQINDAPIYGTLMPFSIENAKIFAIILTRDMGLQHQKNL
jgi:hypothetical protein